MKVNTDVHPSISNTQKPHALQAPSMGNIDAFSFKVVSEAHTILGLRLIQGRQPWWYAQLGNDGPTYQSSLIIR